MRLYRTICVKITRHVYHALEEMATISGRPVSELVREALSLYLSDKYHTTRGIVD